MINNSQLRCKFSKGMFPEELFITVKDINGKIFEFFCNEKYIFKLDESNALVDVRIISKTKKEFIIEIPGCETSNGKNVIVVKSDKLLENK